MGIPNELLQRHAASFQKGHSNLKCVVVGDGDGLRIGNEHAVNMDVVQPGIREAGARE